MVGFPHLLWLNNPALCMCVYNTTFLSIYPSSGSLGYFHVLAIVIFHCCVGLQIFWKLVFSFPDIYSKVELLVIVLFLISESSSSLFSCSGCIQFTVLPIMPSVSLSTLIAPLSLVLLVMAFPMSIRWRISVLVLDFPNDQWTIFMLLLRLLFHPILKKCLFKFLVIF